MYPDLGLEHHAVRQTRLTPPVSNAGGEPNKFGETKETEKEGEGRGKVGQDAQKVGDSGKGNPHFLIFATFFSCLHLRTVLGRLGNTTRNSEGASQHRILLFVHMVCIE